jgi:hypothetical protein
MSFNFIIEPATLESYSIFSKEGFALLKKYVKDYQTGGAGGAGGVRAVGADLGSAATKNYERGGGATHSSLPPNSQTTATTTTTTTTTPINRAREQVAQGPGLRDTLFGDERPSWNLEFSDRPAGRQGPDSMEQWRRRH